MSLHPEVEKIIASYFASGNAVPIMSRPMSREALEGIVALAVEKEREAHQATQAKLDRLMLEFCPDEMTPEQLAEWGRHQVVAPETESLAATRKEEGNG